MEKNKLKSLLLLDLCAFAASLSSPGVQEDVREDYRFAYRWAEKHRLPNCKAYKDLLERL